MLKQLSTLLIVTIVSALIWVFAEAETLRTRDQPLELVFEPDPTSDRVMDVLEGAVGIGVSGQIVRCVVTVEGTATTLDELERLARRPLRVDPISLVTLDPGDHTIDLRTILRDQPDLRHRGYTVKRIDPPQLTISIDQLETKELRVRAAVAGDDVEGVPECKPSRARLRVPARLASTISNDAFAVATPEASEVSRLIPGRRETLVGVPLAMPAGAERSRHARLDPPAVEVSLTLRSRAGTTTIASVPVQIQLAPSEQPNWDIRIDVKDQFIADVKVSGPNETIRQIEEKKLAVVALLPLSFTELEGGRVSSKEVVFFCNAPGLKFEAANRIVPFTVDGLCTVHGRFARGTRGARRAGAAC
jgi:hypothetical protein